MWGSERTSADLLVGGVLSWAFSAFAVPSSIALNFAVD